MIEVSHLSKKYGNHYAISDVSFRVEPGSIYGLLGPNGAGKSTTMNIMTGYIGATEGTVTINGHDIFKDPIKARRYIGYLPEIPPLYMDMTVGEYLLFVAELKGIFKKDIKRAVSIVMEKTKITDMEHRLIKNLSKGYRQRVGLAQAILGNPEIIILDEPMVGLDPLQITEMRELIRELGKDHTVILSSHILSEVSELCDRLLIISNGKLVLSERTENVALHLHNSQCLELVCKGDGELAQSVLMASGHVSDVTYTEGSEDGTIRLQVTATGKDDIREAVSLSLSSNGIAIFEMKEIGQSLEDVFLEMTQKDEPEETEEEAEDESHL